MTGVEKHFNKIASDYDLWKDRNSYYYQNLIALYRSLIPARSTILEIGCGTGDIIARLDPRIGRGIDISEEMIDIAGKKYHSKGNIAFSRENILQSVEPFQEDYIILADVLEHVEGLPDFLKHLSRRTPVSSTVIVSLANPLWEPLLLVAEKLKLKMPEGPHERLFIHTTEKLFDQAGFVVVEKGYRLLVPKRIPGADWINRRFYHNRLFEKFGFTVYWVIKKRPTIFDGESFKKVS